jgi:hypothetical protein
MEAFVYQMQGNEYRLTPFRVARDKFCDYKKKEIMILPKFLKDFNIPDECPIKKGVYSGQYTIEADVPPNFDGKYKILVNLYNQGKPSDSFSFSGEIRRYMYVYVTEYVPSIGVALHKG